MRDLGGVVPRVRSSGHQAVQFAVAIRVVHPVSVNCRGQFLVAVGVLEPGQCDFLVGCFAYPESDERFLSRCWLLCPDRPVELWRGRFAYPTCATAGEASHDCAALLAHRFRVVSRQEPFPQCCRSCRLRERVGRGEYVRLGVSITCAYGSPCLGPRHRISASVDCTRGGFARKRGGRSMHRSMAIPPFRAHALSWGIHRVMEAVPETLHQVFAFSLVGLQCDCRVPLVFLSHGHHSLRHWSHSSRSAGVITARSRQPHHRRRIHWSGYSRSFWSSYWSKAGCLSGSDPPGEQFPSLFEHGSVMGCGPGLLAVVGSRMSQLCEALARVVKTPLSEPVQ